MSSTKARDVPKGTGGNTNKSGGKSANNKGDHKSDKVDLNPKILVSAVLLSSVTLLLLNTEIRVYNIECWMLNS
jgi:hypothetical protein